jgi:hypothetical protein
MILTVLFAVLTALAAITLFNTFSRGRRICLVFGSLTLAPYFGPTVALPIFLTAEYSRLLTSGNRRGFGLFLQRM